MRLLRRSMADRPLFARTVGSVGLTLPPATLGALASAVLLVERSQVTGPIWFFSPNTTISFMGKESTSRTVRSTA